MTRDVATNSTFKERCAVGRERGSLDDARALVAADVGIQEDDRLVSTLVEGLLLVL